MCTTVICKYSDKTWINFCFYLDKYFIDISVLEVISDGGVHNIAVTYKIHKTITCILIDTGFINNIYCYTSYIWK